MRLQEGGNPPAAHEPTITNRPLAQAERQYGSRHGTARECYDHDPKINRTNSPLPDSVRIQFLTPPQLNGLNISRTAAYCNRTPFDPNPDPCTYLTRTIGTSNGAPLRKGRETNIKRTVRHQKTQASSTEHIGMCRISSSNILS
jgi:hypothetical protein